MLGLKSQRHPPQKATPKHCLVIVVVLEDGAERRDCLKTMIVYNTCLSQG